MLTSAAPYRPWLRAAALALALLATSAAAAAAEPPPPVPVERCFQQPAVLQAKLSPSGRQVALTTARGAERVGLVVITLGATPTARSVANFDDADVISFDWVSDERLVFSLADLHYGSREVYERAPGLYAVDADGRRFKQLIRRSGTAFVANGEQRIDVLDANHRLLHVPTPQTGVKPDEVIIGGAEFKARQPELYRCGIAWAAVTDLFLFVKGEVFVTDDISRGGRQYGLRALVGDPDRDAAMLTAVSPLAHGLRLRDALKAAGRPPEWVSYPDDAHG